MFPIGFFLVLAGVWLADSAFHGRPPLTTLKDILQHPGDIGTILEDSKGTAPGIGSSVPKFGVPSAVSGTGQIPKGSAGALGGVVAYLEAQIGKPYKWGTAGPNTFDCSGLGYAAYKSVGITIPRTTAAMLAPGAGKFVAKRNLQPGDAIFPYPGHVYWYVGNGICVEAPHTGSVVHYTKIYQFMTARRFVTAPKRHAPGVQQ